VLCSREAGFDEMLACGKHEALRRGLAAHGDRIVLTAGYPLHVPGTTNLLQVVVL
jgi:pyruvate kinase